MRRTASIHITEDTLAMLIGEQLGYDIRKSRVLAKELCIKAKKYTTSQRKLLVDTTKLAKNAPRIARDTDDATLFAKLLYLSRKKLKHKGIKPITAGDKDWLMIKDLGAKANEFCREFEIKREEGFRAYINLAISKMARITLPKMGYLHESICETYEAKTELEQDETPAITKRVHDYYLTLLIKVTGYGKPIESPEKYLCFKRVCDFCRANRIRPEIYIDAQFEAHAWRNAAPDPHQLLNEKAKERLNQYLYKRKSSATEQEDDKEVKSLALKNFLKDKKKNNKWSS